MLALPSFSTSQLEKPLEWIIQANMPQLSNRMKVKLFTTYGPFATFSVKIDVAHVFGLISADDKRALHAICDVRNAFAHADNELHFHHADLQPLIDKLPNRKKKDPFIAYVDACNECAASLDKRLGQYVTAKMLKDEGASSPEESS